MAKPKSDEAINFDSVIKNLSSDTKASDTPWFKKKSSIIAMSSTLGVGALATVIAVPIALTSGSTTVAIKPSTPEEIAAAIVAFNAKDIGEQIKAFNGMVNDATNSAKIKDYILKQGGMKHFFNTNVEQVTSQPSNSEGVLEAFNKFKSYLLSSPQPTAQSVLNGFLSIKGTIASNNSIIAGENLLCNANPASQYSVYAPANNRSYLFYSIATSSISTFTLNRDFTIKITLKPSDKNFAFEIDDRSITIKINNKRYGSFPLPYNKEGIVFNNLTLFPDMTKYVKTNILKLT